MSYKTIKYNESNKIANITLSRPEVRNAINSEMIEELIDIFEKIELNDEIRVIVLTGEGETFCSGADLNWLREVKDYTYKENYNQSLDLIKLLKIIHNHYKPVICKVNGSAVGGGVGLMLASDIVIADQLSNFGLSEVAIGIVPAAIVPFLLARISEVKAREYLITGNRINANTAKELGLINYITISDELDSFTNQLSTKICNNGRIAVSRVKEMINKFSSVDLSDKNMEYIANVIAKLRTSDEGQEGINAFLDKRKPNWID